MDPDDIFPARKQSQPAHVLGENLDAVSVDELKLRVAALQEEIARIEREIARKQASRNAADSFFKAERKS